MKLIFILIVWLLVWLFAGWYFGINLTADFAVNKSLDSMQDIVKEQLSWNLTQTWANLLEDQKAKIKIAIEEKKEEFKENMKQQIKDYLTQKVDSIFSK